MESLILPWDSEFFGFKIAKVLINDTINEGFKAIINDLKSNDVKLIYCFVDPNNQFNNQIKSQFNGLLVDEKIVYSQNIKNSKIYFDKNIHEYTEVGVNEVLINLAIQSSEYSRFRVDKNFPAKACDKLYTQWINNSIKKIFDNSVYVYQEDNTIRGIITLKDKGDIGTISILSVDKNERGKNIGTKLIQSSFFHYKQKRLFIIEVVTQKSNLPACKFYEKNGFEVKSIENIYHLWL